MGHDNGIKQKLFHGSERDEYQRIICVNLAMIIIQLLMYKHDGSTHMRDEYVHTMVKKAGMHLDIKGLLSDINIAEWQILGDLRDKKNRTTMIIRNLIINKTNTIYNF